jgi:DNA-binding Lrp family transcriptional regulator
MPTTVPRVIGRAPDLDVDIYRALYGGRGVTAIGVDPRVNSSEVARRLKLSRARVATRLAEWTESGLLQKFDVWPNPALLGYEVATVDLRVNDPLEKAAVVERLGVVEGMLGGLEMLGPWMSLQFLARDAEEIGRRAALLRGLAGVAEVTPPVPWAPLEPPRSLTPLDRRILRVLRRYPRDPLSSIARHVGVSTRTITTRYGRLLDDRSVWFVPVLDFRALAGPVLSLQVQLKDASDRDRVARALHREYPHLLEFLRMDVGPQLPLAMAFFIVLAPSAAGVEDVERFARALPGVAGLEVYTMVRMLSFPATFDRLLAEAGAGRSSTRAVPAEANP